MKKNKPTKNKVETPDHLWLKSWFAGFSGVIKNMVSKTLELRRKYLVWALILIVVGVSGVSIYFYNRYRQATQDPQEIAKTESEKLLTRVSKITLLPTGETPTIATISDPEKLKNQPFFYDAQSGDKVLIYTKAKKAYIYRPSINKIISIAPLMVGGSPEFNTPASK